MNDLIFTVKSSSNLPSELLRRLFAFRHEVFVTRLGWVPPRGDEEVDFFDTLNPVHALCQDRDGAILAAARLLPMAGPSMLRDVFPALLGSAPCPQDAETWEISRFALRPVPGVRAGHRQVLLALVARLFEIAQAHGVRRLVAVSDTRLERMVTDATGLPLQRFAPPQRVGTEWAVAGCVEVSGATQAQLAAHARRRGPARARLAAA